MHVSADCVFDGSSPPYTTVSKPNPLSEYGRCGWHSGFVLFGSSAASCNMLQKNGMSFSDEVGISSTVSSWHRRLVHKQLYSGSPCCMARWKSLCRSRCFVCKLGPHASASNSGDSFLCDYKGGDQFICRSRKRHSQPGQTFLMNKGHRISQAESLLLKGGFNLSLGRRLSLFEGEVKAFPPHLGPAIREDFLKVSERVYM